MIMIMIMIMMILIMILITIAIIIGQMEAARVQTDVVTYSAVVNAFSQDRMCIVYVYIYIYIYICIHICLYIYIYIYIYGRCPIPPLIFDRRTISPKPKVM